MIDMHSHILPGIDDGSPDIDTSIQMLKEAYEAGFTGIVSTSHYIKEGWCALKEEREELIKQIEQKLEQDSIDIKIYNGVEAYISDDLYELIQNNKLPTINGSKYLLIELPMNTQLVYLGELIYSLTSRGITPIVAHPERYSYVQKNHKVLEDLIRQRVLFQANYGSIIGKYGREAQKTLKKLLKNNLIHFLGVDAHRAGGTYTQMNEILKKLEKIVGKEKVEILSTINPERVLKNESIVE